MLQHHILLFPVLIALTLGFIAIFMAAFVFFFILGAEPSIAVPGPFPQSATSFSGAGEAA